MVMIICAKNCVEGYNVVECKALALTHNYQNWGVRFYCISDEQTAECKISVKSDGQESSCYFAKKYSVKLEGYGLVKKECNTSNEYESKELLLRIEHDATLQGNECILDIKYVLGTFTK